MTDVHADRQGNKPRDEELSKQLDDWKTDEGIPTHIQNFTSKLVLTES